MIKIISIALFALVLSGCGDTVNQSASGSGTNIIAKGDSDVVLTETTNEAAIPVVEEENVIGCSDESKLDPESDCFEE